MVNLVANPKLPAIPEPLANLPSLLTTVKAIRQGLQNLSGARGDPLDRAVTFNDLILLGLTTDGAALTVSDLVAAAAAASSAASGAAAATAAAAAAAVAANAAAIAANAAAALATIVATLYRIVAYVPGTPISGQVLLRFTAVDTTTIPAGMTNSRVTADVASVGSFVATISAAQGANAPNTFTTVGTITFTASAIATLVLASPVTLAPGDVLHVTCTTPDTALSNMTMTIAAIKS